MACQLLGEGALQSGEYCLIGTCMATSSAPFKDNSSGTPMCVPRCPLLFTLADNLTCSAKCDDYFVDKLGNYICAPICTTNQFAKLLLRGDR